MFIELLSERNLVKNLQQYNKNKKSFLISRILHIILLVIMVTMAYYLSRELEVLIALPFAALVGYKLPYYNLLNYHEKRNKLNRQLFPEFLTTFIALLPTSGNVYQALVATLPYTKNPLKKSLEELIESIEDGNDRKDYLEFAETVATSEAFMLMDMIYQFSEYGIKTEALLEMQRFSQELDKNKMTELINQKINRMESLGLTPIFISIFFVISFAAIVAFHYLRGISDIITF